MQNKNTDQALQAALKLKPDMTLAEFNEMQAQPLPGMQTKETSPTRAKLVVGVGIIIFAWIIVAVYSVFQIVYAYEAYTHIFHDGVSRTVASYQMQSEMRDLRQVLTASALYAHNTNETERQNALNYLMDKAHQIRASLFFALDDYDFSVVTDPMQTQEWVHIKLEMTQYLRQLSEIIFNLYLQEVYIHAFIGDYYRASSVFTESTAVFFAFTDEVNHLLGISEDSMQHAFYNAHDTIYITVMTITLINVVAVIVSVIVAVILLLPKRNARVSAEQYI